MSDDTPPKVTQKRTVYKPRGRPPGRLDDKPRHKYLFMAAVTERILDAIRAGATQDLAAQYAGITQSTLRGWLKEGEQCPPGDPMHTFYLEFHKARGEKAKITLERLQQIAESVNSWQGLAWILEHSFPKDFGKGIFGGDPSEAPEIKHVIEIIRDTGDARPAVPEETRATRYQLSGPGVDGFEDADNQTEFPVISPAD